jgi:hypothetical protein
MGAEKFDVERISIISASNVDKFQLIEFYQNVFSDRVAVLQFNWEWINRSAFYENKIPLIMLYEGEIVAHSGMIPFRLSFKNENLTASWFIDFKVLPAFQRFGLGTVLTKEWMNFSDCYVTFCNEKSIGVFRKYGWVESFDTYMHLNFMHAFNHPGFIRLLPSFIRKILNLLFYPFIYIIYSRLAYSSKNYHLQQLTERLFNEFYNDYLETGKLKVDENILRDPESVQWRILNSPNKDKYHVYKVQNFSAIVSLQNNHGKYIDVLWVSDLSNKLEIAKMIASLGLYGLKNGYAYLRFFTTKKELSDFIKTQVISLVSHPRFAYFSKNEIVFEKLRSVEWNFELLDSDFEHIK